MKCSTIVFELIVSVHFYHKKNVFSIRSTMFDDHQTIHHSYVVNNRNFCFAQHKNSIRNIIASDENVRGPIQNNVVIVYGNKIYF